MVPNLKWDSLDTAMIKRLTTIDIPRPTYRGYCPYFINNRTIITARYLEKDTAMINWYNNSTTKTIHSWAKEISLYAACFIILNHCKLHVYNF